MGRTLDYECSYGEEVTITPRGYTFVMRHGQPYQTKYALIGNGTCGRRVSAVL